MEICLVLHNIRSAYNVGAILRTAEGFGVSEVILSGITPRVDDPRVLPHLREKLNRQIGKTALGAERMVPILLADDIAKELARRKEDGWQLVGLENNLEDERLVRLGSEELSARLGSRVVLVLGEEVTGIGEDLLGLMEILVEIPMAGRKESFNVSVATGVAIWGLKASGVEYSKENEETVD